MACPTNLGHTDQPHLVSLVLQSKKALQHGEQLCSRARVLSNASAQYAVDVLALDAKVRWITDAVLEQLKLAACVAKDIEEKLAQIHRRVKEWDASRTQHVDALDGILESLGTQLVPPGFHQTSADSSLFGSQHSNEERSQNGHAIQESPNAVRLSPTIILHPSQKERRRIDRSKWKTLRDFVDDRAIEDVLENIESDRAAIDDTLAKTEDYPDKLVHTIAIIRNTLPIIEPVTSIETTMASQDTLIHNMASQLESLAAHDDQMEAALRDTEAGESFGEEDLQAMNRDTEELPSIMVELEDSLASVQGTQEQLERAKGLLQNQLEQLEVTLDDLDELSEIMDEMLQHQHDTETKAEEQLTNLERQLVELEHLHQQFVSYQTSFCKLILEIARRRQYSEDAENTVKGMMSQLEAMTEEETQVRNHFNEEHGAHLPEDICLCIINMPTKWEVVPRSQEIIEALPDIDGDIITEASQRLHAATEDFEANSMSEKL